MHQDRFRSREDEITFRRWRLGVFILYSTTVVLLAGLATATHRPETFASAAAITNPVIASADTKRH
jgi:hypothetical protein